MDAWKVSPTDAVAAFPADPAAMRPGPGLWLRQNRDDPPDQRTRSASIFFTSAMALAGLRPLGQTWAQFMIVWQR